MTVRPLRFWGWGYADEPIDEDEAARFVGHACGELGVGDLTPLADPTIDDLDLRAPRLTPPDSLAEICSAAPYDRAVHAYGKSFPDYARVLARDFSNPPDVIAYPRHEQDVVDLLDWAGRAEAAVVPFAGGSSVCGGVEAPAGGYAGTLTIDLRRLDRVLEVDTASRAARIQGGVFGPALEAQLRPHGLTLRHFPQSYEFSSLGGWIVTRSGGHFATLYTHIEELVEATRMVSPSGIGESRRLPGSGAGPSPDRLVAGSEGILGILTEAWMRLQDRPTFRAAASVWFDDFYAGAQAIRAVSQAGLYPANCRLIDAREAKMSLAGDGSAHLMVLGFESADHPVEPWLARALECCADHGGRAETEGGHLGGGAGAWRQAFIRAPFYRDRLVARGLIHDTFETSITWDRLQAFHGAVIAAGRDVVRRVTGRDGIVTCRFTHTYPDGPAPYFTIHAVGAHDALLSQWQEIKTAMSDAIFDAGGTITHHHAVGRDHRPWYDRQRPEPFARALAAAKHALDPKGLLNPGVLIDPIR